MFLYMNLIIVSLDVAFGLHRPNNSNCPIRLNYDYIYIIYGKIWKF